MWIVVLVGLLSNEVFGLHVVELTQTENKTDSIDGLKSFERKEKLDDDLADWTSLLLEENSTLPEPGRRLKHKRAEFRFLMKLLVVLKVVFSFVLPLGIIASKIISWKAVTLSLMAFMLAKILLVKNLLMGKNAYSVAPANIVPPFLIQGASNDAFWKRQGDGSNIYPWNTT